MTNHCATLRRKAPRDLPDGPCNFWRSKTDNQLVSSKTSADGTTPEDLRQRYAYPYFRLHVEEIRTWFEGGCTAKAVWRSYTNRPAAPFPGSYSSFLRYCRKHGLHPASASRPTRTAPARKAERPPSALASGAKRYPAPPDRHPGIISFSED
jgi:hypothetical protein